MYNQVTFFPRSRMTAPLGRRALGKRTSVSLTKIEYQALLAMQKEVEFGLCGKKVSLSVLVGVAIMLASKTPKLLESKQGRYSPDDDTEDERCVPMDPSILNEQSVVLP